MAVHAQTQHRDAATASKQARGIARQGERIVNDSARLGARGTDKMLDQTEAALTATAARSEKLVRDSHEFVSASLTPDIRKKIPAAAPVVDGIQDLQRASAEFLRRYIDRSVQVHRELLQSRSLPEVSALQRKYFLENISDFADVSRSVIDISARIARQSTHAITGRLSDMTDQVKQAAQRR